jgi:hypothetical protein
MAQSRLRPAPHSPDASSAEATLAEWPRSSSLPELKEAMSSPGVIQEEVDALFAAIARPPADDETPRARADFLLSLMELPEEARDRKGRDGRTVRAAAVEALMALGYPYALEVPPDVLEAVRIEAGRGGDASASRVSVPATIVTVLALVFQVVVVALYAFSYRSQHTREVLQQFLLALTVAPPLMALFGHAADLRRMQSLGARGMALQGLLWLLYALSQDASSFWQWLTVALLPWHLPLIAAYLMRSKSEGGDTLGSPVEPS